MENICDLANARTTIPPNLVRVIPDKTELPMLVRTLLEINEVIIVVVIIYVILVQFFIEQRNGMSMKKLDPEYKGL